MEISIRPYSLNDPPLLFDAATESVNEIYPFMPWCHPNLSVNEVWKWVNDQISAFSAGRQFEFVIVAKNGRVLGGCGLNQIDQENRRANLGYWVRTSATRQGVATNAIKELVEWGYQNTNLIRIEIVVSSKNQASLRAAEKAGAVKEGLLRNRILLHGTPHDAVMFSFVRDVK
jgi:RimJ/RimL family protein N-acetyltransferase